MAGRGRGCIPILLLLAVLVTHPPPPVAASACEAVPWEPRRSVLFVAQDLRSGAGQRATLQVAAALAHDYTVELAAPVGAGPMLEAYHSLGLTVHTLDVAGGSVCGLMRELVPLFMQYRYVGLVWSITDLWAAHRCVQPLPGAFSVLWVLHDRWPLGNRALDADWTRVLAFDHVVFGTKAMLVKYATLINPSGHLPISFLLLNYTNPTPTVTRPLAQRLAVYLGHWEAEAEGSYLRLMGLVSLKDTAAKDGLTLPETCPNTAFAQLAVVIHLGRHRAERLHRVLSALKHYPQTIHIWVTYTRADNRVGVLNLLEHRGAVMHLLNVRDHGLDLGPFFVFMWHMVRCRYQYSYLLKYHFKSNDEHDFTRQAAVFFKQRGFLAQAVAHLDLRRQVAAVYPRIEGSEELAKTRQSWEFFGHNYWYLKELYETLAVPVPGEGFLAGTVWLTRSSALTRWLHSTAQIWGIYADLNDPMGLDWRWYSRVVLQADCNRSATRRHYYVKGRAENLPPNCYAPIPGYSEAIRDGMLEHAWERFLSWMISTAGPIEPLPVP